MINAKEFVSKFSIPEKIELLNQLYSELSGYGKEGDTELAHVNRFEARWLKSMGGSGTLNEVTNLREYKGGGSAPPPPAPVTTQDITQTAEFPEELQPHVERITGEAEAEYDVSRDEGFLPFRGPRIAAFRPEQLQAQELGRQQFGTGLAGTGLGDPTTYYDPALQAALAGQSTIGTGLEAAQAGIGAGLTGLQEITPEQLQAGINPFQQNVIDIAKREAERVEEGRRQQRGAEAAGAASFGGSRAGLREAEAERNLSQQLSDIQERGLAQGYDRAFTNLENQRRRQVAAAQPIVQGAGQIMTGAQQQALGSQQLGRLGEAAADRARKQISGLSGVGEVSQAQRQLALDLAQQQFEQEKFFPKGELQAYQSIIRGFPAAQGLQRVTREPIVQPRLSSQLINAGLSGLNLYGQTGGFGAGKRGGHVGSFAGGGIVSLEGAGSLEDAIGGDINSGREDIFRSEMDALEQKREEAIRKAQKDLEEREGLYTASDEERQAASEYVPPELNLLSVRGPDELQTLIESQTAIGPAGQQYSQMIEDYKKQMKNRPTWTAGLGPAAEESQRLTEEARSARGGLGAFQQPTFLEQLSAAANAASGGIKEERDRRQVVQGHLAKEAAAAEAAAHQQQIENLIRYKEAGGKGGKFKPTQQSTLEISTSAGNRLPGFDVENDVQLTDFRNKINIISNALHDNPDLSDRSLYETGTKASELVSLAWDPKTEAFDVDVLNKITLAAQHARDGVVDESGRIPPLEVIEKMVGYAQQRHPDDPDKQTALFFGLMGQPLKRLDVDIHGPAPALQPEVTEEESSVTEEISDRDALEAERERKIREHQEWMNNRP